MTLAVASFKHLHTLDDDADSGRLRNPFALFFFMVSRNRHKQAAQENWPGFIDHLRYSVSIPCQFSTYENQARPDISKQKKKKITKVMRNLTKLSSPSLRPHNWNQVIGFNNFFCLFWHFMYSCSYWLLMTMASYFKSQPVGEVEVLKMTFSVLLMHSLWLQKERTKICSNCFSNEKVKQYHQVCENSISVCPEKKNPNWD